VRKSIVTLLASVSGLLLCAGLAVASGHHHGHQFENSSFQGTYADTFHGTADGTGVLTADGNGKITSGSETVSDGTNVCQGTLTGTYTVNPDGTGTLTTSFTTTSTIHGTCPNPASPLVNNAAIVLRDRRDIDTSSTDNGGLLVSGHLGKQHNDNGVD
jgi:hypothetical protein